MTTKEDILKALKLNKRKLSKIGVWEVGLFGSYLRDEQSNESDVDLLIDFEPGKETFENYMAVCDLLESIFNKILKRATIRSLEIIGEAAKNTPWEFKERWDLIPWKNMAGMRDKLIHNYFGVNYSIGWDIIQNSIPELHEQIKQVLAQEQSSFLAPLELPLRTPVLQTPRYYPTTFQFLTRH